MSIDHKQVPDPTDVDVTWPSDKPGTENDPVRANLHVQCQLCGNVVVPATMAAVKHCPKCGKVLDGNRPNAVGVLT
jgi:hypothetical protein